MIGGLFFFNVLLCLITFLAISMLQNHFNKIQESMDIYLDTKAYKTDSKIKFISRVLNQYQKLSQESMNEARLAPPIDVEVMTYKVLYEEKIGKFSYLSVQRIANKGKVLMWGVLILQIGLEVLGERPGESIEDFIFIIASTFLCMIITLIGIIRNVGDLQKQLVIKVHDYVVNTYPVNLAKRTKQQEIKELMEKIQKLENELELYQQNSEEKKEVLNGKEIMHLLNEIDLHV